MRLALRATGLPQCEVCAAAFECIESVRGMQRSTQSAEEHDDTRPKGCWGLWCRMVHAAYACRCAQFPCSLLVHGSWRLLTWLHHKRMRGGEKGASAPLQDAAVHVPMAACTLGMASPCLQQAGALIDQVMPRLGASIVRRPLARRAEGEGPSKGGRCSGQSASMHARVQRWADGRMHWAAVRQHMHACTRALAASRC